MLETCKPLRRGKINLILFINVKEIPRFGLFYYYKEIKVFVYKLVRLLRLKVVVTLLRY